MNILKNMNQYLNWRNFRFISLIIIGLFLVGEIGFANTQGNSGTTKTASETDAGAWITGVVNILLRGGAVILAALTTMVGYFLQPEWVNGELFNLGTILKKLWIMVSNVIYLIFALLLIVIAFMNIVNPQNTNWGLKQALPKFIIGVLIVPFSWFFVSLIVSISSVLTISVLTLPFDSFDAEVQPILEELEKYEVNLEEDDKICVSHIIYMGSKKETTDSKNPDGKIYECAEDGKKTLSEIIKSIFDGNESDSIYGIINIYTYGIMEVDSIETLKKKKLDAIGGIKDLLNLGFDLIFNLLFMLIYIILMVALFIALFVRGILLWLYMIFSPVFGLLFFLGDKAPSDKFNIKEFISLALVPVYVAAALSFGLLFLLMASNSDNFKSPNNDSEKIEVGIFSIQLEGVAGSGANHMGVKSTLGEIIIKVFGLVILWIGVMAALKSNTITAQVTAPIEQFGTQVGTLVAKSPMYAPIIPGMGGEGGKSIASLGKLPNLIQGSISNKVADDANKLFQNTPFGDQSNITTNLTKAINGLKQDSSDNGIKTGVDNILKAVDGRAEKLYSTPEGRRALFQLMTSAKLKVDGIEKAEDIVNPNSVEKIFNKLEDNPRYKDAIKNGKQGGVQWKDIEEDVKGAKGQTSTNSTQSANNNTSSSNKGGDDFSKLKDADGDKLRGLNNVRYKEAGANQSGDTNHVFHIKDGRGSGYEKFEFTINTGASSTMFDNDDKEVFKKIHNQLGNDDDFKKLLTKLQFDTNNHEDLINSLK